MAATPLYAFRLNQRDAERIELLRRDLETRSEQPVSRSDAVRHALRVAATSAAAQRSPLGESRRGEYEQNNR